jgi:fatty acid synthase subunit beta
MVGGAQPLQVGGICHPEARIVPATNSSEGKIVKVQGYCYHGNQSIIKVVSSFLYRGRFLDYENTFDSTEEPDYLVHLGSDADVRVLQSKEGFEWENELSPLLVLHLFSAFNPRSSSRTRADCTIFSS